MFRWFRIQPKYDEGQESPNDTPQSCNPWPGTTDCPGSWPLVVREMTHGDLPLLFDTGQPRSLVIYFEGEDTVLVGCGEGSGVDRAVGGDGRRGEWDALERGEHAKFKLKSI